MAASEDPEKDAPRETSGGEDLPPEELEDQRGETLPPRESMSVVGGDVSIPLDPSVAADVLADESELEDEEEPER